MKTFGWILIVFGALAFIGAASKGDSVFGPLFWMGLGGALIYLKREREEKGEVNVNEKAVTVPISQNRKDEPLAHEAEKDNGIVEHGTPVTFAQKEAALCLVAFFAGYNDDIMGNDAAFMISYQAAIFFGIEDYQAFLTTALPKYQDADKMINTVLTIKDQKSKQFILLTCYDLTKMSGKAEAYEFLYNVANEMGYNKLALLNLIKQYSGNVTSNGESQIMI